MSAAKKRWRLKMFLRRLCIQCADYNYRWPKRICNRCARKQSNLDRRRYARKRNIHKAA